MAAHPPFTHVRPTKSVRVAIVDLWENGDRVRHPGPTNLLATLTEEAWLFADSDQSPASSSSSTPPPPPPVVAELVTPLALKQGFLARGGFHVVMFPGGSATRQSNAIGRIGRELVRRFIREGGGYVGCCAGAFLASAYYNDSLSLGILPSTVLVRSPEERLFVVGGVVKERSNSVSEAGASPETKGDVTNTTTTATATAIDAAAASATESRAGRHRSRSSSDSSTSLGAAFGSHRGGGRKARKEGPPRLQRPAWVVGHAHVKLAFSAKGSALLLDRDRDRDRDRDEKRKTTTETTVTGGAAGGSPPRLFSRRRRSPSVSPELNLPTPPGSPAHQASSPTMRPGSPTAMMVKSAVAVMKDDPLLTDGRDSLVVRYHNGPILAAPQLLQQKQQHSPPAPPEVQGEGRRGQRRFAGGSGGGGGSSRPGTVRRRAKVSSSGSARRRPVTSRGRSSFRRTGPGSKRDDPCLATEFEVLATFAQAACEPGPMAERMKGAAAIATSMYGKGRVLVISPHPESTHPPPNLSKAAGGLAPQQRLVQRAVLFVARDALVAEAERGGR